MSQSAIKIENRKHMDEFKKTGTFKMRFFIIKYFLLLKCVGKQTIIHYHTEKSALCKVK